MPRPTTSTGFKVDLSDFLRTGLQLNKFDKGIPFWASADGIQFTSRGIRRKPTRTLIVDLGSEPIRGITAINEFNTKVAYVGDLSTLYSYRLDTAASNTVGTGYNLTEKGGATVWDSGSTTWDSGSTVWDEGINEADQWSFTNFGTFVFAANGTDRVQVKKNNINFNDLHSTEVSGATVNAGGSGYAVDDTVTHTGGSGTGFATTITEVDAGAVVAFEITNFGSGYANGETLTQNTTSGSGTGFTLDVTVPDAPFTTARIVTRLGPHVLLFNYSTAAGNFPFSFTWCSEDDTDTWVAASTNSAGSLTIREATSPIRCVKPLADGLGVYTDSQLFIVNYVGAPFYFGYRPVMEGALGAVSIDSVAVVNRTHYVLSSRGLFVTDGSNVQRIGIDEGIVDWIEDNIASSELAQVVAYHNQRDTEVVWMLPVGDTKPTKELYFNYENGTFGMRSATTSALLERGVFLNAISGDDEGKIYFEDEGIGAQTTTGRTRAHDLDDPDHIKEVTYIRVGKRGTGNPTIKVGWAESIGETPTFTDTFTVNSDYDEVAINTAGRYLFLDISSSGASDTWEISHLEVIGRTGGTR